MSKMHNAEDESFQKTRLDNLKDSIAQLDRVKLAQLPTPLVELRSLSATLNGPRIFIKRDDLTGDLTSGGNKTRMLEFRLAPAVNQKADILVSGFGIQSNHARQVAAAARKLGMDTRLLLRRTRSQESILTQGNLLIDLLLGASIKIVDSPSFAEHAKLIEEEAEHLEAQGRKPYVTGYADEDLSAVAYVACSLEMFDQMLHLGIKPDYIYVASEGATQAGLVLFSKYMEDPYQVIGINMVDWVDDIPLRISSIANTAANRLQIDLQIEREDIVNYGEYVGDGYGVPTAECISAIKLLAETEGILLDPVYSGKAMAGLINHVRMGRIGKDKTVIFLHTGGVPALFRHPDTFDFPGRFNSDEHS